MNELIRVEPIALLPTQAGCAVFLGDENKVIVFYIDPSIGASINAILAKAKPPRPLTHDLFTLTLEAFGAEVLHTTIVDVQGDVFYSRLYIKAENEIMERKIVELDARPSDCIAMAVRQQAPIFVVPEVWARLEDVSETLSDLRNQPSETGGYGLEIE
ncbi:MAG: bifunctional nuclease family protein [Akkermansiaceae bacterium]|jgi:bifunctional DNase/RNase|nr:bifunctional nuclease family protein [Akkermansiaceae bacterium]